MNKIEKVVRKLRFNTVKKEKFLAFLKNLFGLFDEPQTIFETLKARGLPIEEIDGKVVLKTAKTLYKHQEFVVVDIETNGSKPQNSQVIEIGAVKFKGDRIIDRFESFIYASEVPEYISKLTGIYQKDLQNAPPEKEILKKFKEFLGDAVFIAHNVGFDYNFISSKLEEIGLEKLANRKLCSIDLARRTIESERYGLEFLNESLGINSKISHRAYADALTAYKVVQLAFKNLPKEVKTTEDLIDFSKKGLKS